MEVQHQTVDHSSAEATVVGSHEDVRVWPELFRSRRDLSQAVERVVFEVQLDEGQGEPAQLGEAHQLHNSATQVMVELRVGNHEDQGHTDDDGHEVREVDQQELVPQLLAG